MFDKGIRLHLIEQKVDNVNRAVELAENYRLPHSKINNFSNLKFSSQRQYPRVVSLNKIFLEVIQGLTEERLVAFTVKRKNI